MTFAELRERLIEKYFSGERSLTRQITLLVDHGRDFEVLNRSRFGDESKTLASRNPIVAGFIDIGFIYSQVFGISRLTDPFKEGTERQVITIPSVLTEIERNRNIISRESFTAPDPNESPEFEAFWVQRKQSLFDWLSGKGPDNRSNDDKIHNSTFQTVKRILDRPEIKATRLYRDKILAHTASAENFARAVRHLPADQLLDNENVRLTIRGFEKAQRAICVVTAFMDQVLLFNNSASFAPVAQYDPFEGLSDQWWDTDQEEFIRTSYDLYGRRRDEWSENCFRVVSKLRLRWHSI